ncbi:MAG: V-type ATPase subunit [Treponema sp.]|nr:V-type ATPase subunit [Treponema sp.]
MFDDNGFAYAKACGIIGKSFLGKRASYLSGLHSLNDLDKLVFSQHRRDIPDKELLADFKRRIEKRTLEKILPVIKSYTPSVKLLELAFKGYKYSELLDTGAALDMGYYKELLESLSQLDSEDRATAQMLIADEICICNCLWALRLRTYYNMPEEQVKKHLLDLRFHGEIFEKKQSLIARANESLNFHLDIRRHWDGWRWEKFLNPEEDARHWIAMPRYFQNAACAYLRALAYHQFHSNPLTLSSIYCFIKLMQYEEDILISTAETIALGMESSSVLKTAESKGEN